MLGKMSHAGSGTRQRVIASSGWSPSLDRRYNCLSDNCSSPDWMLKTRPLDWNRIRRKVPLIVLHCLLITDLVLYSHFHNILTTGHQIVVDVELIVSEQANPRNNLSHHSTYIRGIT